MTALDGALALAQVHDIAVDVAEDLHLDVARLGEIALEEDGGVSKGRLRFASRRLQGVVKVLRALDDADDQARARYPALGLMVVLRRVEALGDAVVPAWLAAALELADG